MTPTSDDALLELFSDIATRDERAVTHSLDGERDLATRTIRSGASRNGSDAYFLIPISRTVYAGDTALHIAAASYQQQIAEELVALGEHCSKMERRAETAERELIKIRLLTYLSTRLGEQLDAVITGVADYGFFAQAERFPAEGLVHISSLVDDYYWFDEGAHTLEGRRTKRRFRLGDRVHVEVARVDLQRRMLDLRLAGSGPKAEDDGEALPSYGRFPKRGKRRR